ncbi:uncharacterized protein LOC123712396 isoform X1 [Pieris brassicae]|uniref:uncharacterized protein LOC123712396 isoform X1 n=2 Tax=Pieris brassicae TaxID=7116 RepID=UPI001E660F88|nr:uncharacterized protein LOC123712396 isoform X1 [Pieris brassicae]
MYGCSFYNLDNVFKQFKVVEFPISFVGLSTSQVLDVENDLNTCSYLKTIYDGNLIKFDEAREISASHRAFTVVQKDEHLIEITFTPTTECISKAKRSKQFDNRFVFDLRLIRVDGSRCCYNELHSEIGRYYISGQFEYSKISHTPEVVDFGDTIINNRSTKKIRIWNESNLMTSNMRYVRVTGFEVTPYKFSVPPNSSKKVTISIKPTCLKLGNKITFEIRNPQDSCFDKVDENDNPDINFLTYTIKLNMNVRYQKKRNNNTKIESMHKLNCLNPQYTYVGNELKTHMARKEVAFKFLEISKSSYAKKPVFEKYCSGKEQCYSVTVVRPVDRGANFCKKIPEKISTYDLFNIIFTPYCLNFGRVGLLTYGEHELVLQNNTKHEFFIEFLKDKCVLYEKDKKKTLKMKMRPYDEKNITIFCLASIEGISSGTFEYIIDKKYYRKHPYSLEVGNPALMLYDKSLKFGMVSAESFITSVPIKIFNHFNLPVNFKWDELHSDIPFEIKPTTGTIPKHSCKICDVIYVCKATKTKTHEVELISEGRLPKNIPIELSVITRKLTIKFLQLAIIFKDISLNLETTERVKLENSSREIALFHVVEPLIPGFKIEPMCGIIRPKMIITFEISVKIPCIMEFAFDILLKINNKENVILPVSGNVMEPKILIHPKNIIMSRVPCNMITYVPITFQNLSSLKTVVSILDMGDENIFNVYQAVGNERQQIFEFTIEGGQSKTVFIKVFDIFRREYEMFIPFKINGLLGPPCEDESSTELQYYVGEYEKFYENNSKVKLKPMNKDIAYCRLTGVITVPWIDFSVDKFELSCGVNKIDSLQFTMTNVSKYNLYITILTSKLAPMFTLDLITEENQSIINETHIKFELDRGMIAKFTVVFQPKSHGRFVSTALLYLDKQMTIPYYNLTFIGKKQNPVMIPSSHRLIFPPCYPGQEITQTITLRIETKSSLEDFSCSSKEESHLTVALLESEVILEDDLVFTTVRVDLSVSCKISYARNMTIHFNHVTGSCCDIEVTFCFTYCPLTLHTNWLVTPSENPYPLYPEKNQHELYEYMESCTNFLEKWMFQQGFRRDLYPIIPDTFHAISTALSSQGGGTKSKGINVSYLNFVKRIAGPLMKHVRKVTITGVDETYKTVKEIHDTYREVIGLLRSRGANLWVLQAKFLLSHEQFLIYSDNVTPKGNADIILNEELKSDINLFNRINKQSWIDFILQSYKVFVMDSCFFDCVCVSGQPRDVVKVLIDWYNENILYQHGILRDKQKPIKTITNITTDLSDGIAIISSILTFCPFTANHFSFYCEIDNTETEGCITNNACLIIEALNMLRLYFPLSSKDFLQPNFLLMLFLSIHLYVTLPMFKPKNTVNFYPPLLRSSTRQVAISPTSQESLIFNHVILQNTKNNFMVEKITSPDNGKKMFLSVKYNANFVEKETAILLVHGYNKTRIFDTYLVFVLHGYIGSLNPVRKCKVTGPLYRPNRVDVLVSSPFSVTANFNLFLTDIEPTIPVEFPDDIKPRFYLRRLNLIDKEVSLTALPKESGQDVQEHKLFLQIICLSTQMGNSWIWFRSDIGEFFIKVTTQARWDLAIDTLQAKVKTWPMDPCSCGESCECYRTTVLTIPHRNELMLKSLRYALLEHSSDTMMQVFDQLIETGTGKIILSMLLSEGGTNLSEVQHILRNESVYRISSRALLPRIDRVTLQQHTHSILILPITIPAQDKSEKYTVTLTSECGMDIRTYRILFVENSNEFV